MSREDSRDTPSTLVEPVQALSISPQVALARRLSAGHRRSSVEMFDLASEFYPTSSPSPDHLQGRDHADWHHPQPIRSSGLKEHHIPVDHPADRSTTPIPSTPPAELPLKETRAMARDQLEKRNEVGPKLVIFMVGLPARGKSYICQKLKRYLNWMGFKVKVFNVGNRRRVVAHEEEEQHPPKPVVDHLGRRQSHGTSHDASFFDPRNQDAAKQRERLAMDTLEELLAWLREGGKIAIHDATNSVSSRRRALLERVKNEPNVNYVFVESICTDDDILAKNVQMKLKSPDYVGMDPEEALADFRKRMANYERAYEPIGEEEEGEDLSFVKIINVGKKVTAYNVHGYLASQCVFYLMNMHIKQRFIWLTRHGESQFNVEGKVGGDPSLTERGRRYAQALAKFIEARQSGPEIAVIDGEEVRLRNGNLQIWTSKLKRTIETGDYFDDKFEVTHMRFLNEIHSGVCEGMTYDHIAHVYPMEFKTRQANKLVGRYPGGENYLDVIERLRPIIIELERMETDVLIITHNVVMRTLLAYYSGLDLMEMTNLDVPLHTLYMLEPKPYGVELKKFRYIEELDTFEAVHDGIGIVSSNSAWTELKAVSNNAEKGLAATSPPPNNLPQLYVQTPS